MINKRLVITSALVLWVTGILGLSSFVAASVVYRPTGCGAGERLATEAEIRTDSAFCLSGVFGDTTIIHMDSGGFTRHPCNFSNNFGDLTFTSKSASACIANSASSAGSVTLIATPNLNAHSTNKRWAGEIVDYQITATAHGSSTSPTGDITLHSNVTGDRIVRTSQSPGRATFRVTFDPTSIGRLLTAEVMKDSLKFSISGITMLKELPDPTNFQARRSGNQVELSWERVQAPSGVKYELLRRSGAGGVFASIADSLESSHYPDREVSSQNYFYEIKAVLNGSKSRGTITPVPEIPLTPPQNVVVRQDGSNLVVTWDPPVGIVGEEVLYSVYRKVGTDPNFSMIAKQIPGTRYSQPMPAPHASYFSYKVRAFVRVRTRAESGDSNEANLTVQNRENVAYVAVRVSGSPTANNTSLIVPHGSTTVSAVIVVRPIASDGTLATNTLPNVTLDVDSNLVVTQATPHVVNNEYIFNVTFTRGIHRVGARINGRPDLHVSPLSVTVHDQIQAPTVQPPSGH